MRRLLQILSIVLASLVPASAAEEFPAADRQALTAIIEKGMIDQRQPGLIVGIWAPGQGALVQAFGKGDLKTGAAMALDDHMRIASVTKTFTATAILQLVDQGKLALDDKLSQFIDGIPNGDRIAIRNMLDMTSGIFDFTIDQSFMDKVNADPLMSFSPDDVIEILRRNEADFAPGEKVIYCDTNFILLGVILEKVAKAPAIPYIMEHVVAPAMLTQTNVPNSPDMPEPYAHGYYAGEDAKGPLEDFTRSNPELPWTAGAMVSTLADLKIWAKALATGTLLSRKMQAERLAFHQFTNMTRASYGLGVMNFSGFIGHYGMIFGYTTAMFYLPEADATIIVLGNQSSNAGMSATEIFLELAKYLYPEKFK
jgi:D-alanyl-D-alanine carboxypeptidase